MTQHHPPQHENPLDFTPEPVPASPNEATDWWSQCFPQHEGVIRDPDQPNDPAYVPNFPL